MNDKNAYQAACKILAIREHSSLELYQKLVIKNYNKQEIEQALTKLKAQNYQNDDRFANEFTKMRFNQGKGSIIIKNQLAQKGIKEQDIYLSEFDFFALAKSVRVKKFGQEIPKKYQEKAKQMRFLQSRGFSLDQIQAAFTT